jgi:hypothetical protein
LSTAPEPHIAKLARDVALEIEGIPATFPADFKA